MEPQKGILEVAEDCEASFPGSALVVKMKPFNMSTEAKMFPKMLFDSDGGDWYIISRSFPERFDRFTKKPKRLLVENEIEIIPMNKSVRGIMRAGQTLLCPNAGDTQNSLAQKE